VEMLHIFAPSLDDITSLWCSYQIDCTKSRFLQHLFEYTTAAIQQMLLNAI